MTTGIKNFDHLLLSLSKDPAIPFTLKGIQFDLKPKVCVEATLALIGSGNSLQGMINYMILSLVNSEQEDTFRGFLDDFSMEGLGEIVDWYVEAASGNDEKPSTDS